VNENQCEFKNMADKPLKIDPVSVLPESEIASRYVSSYSTIVTDAAKTSEREPETSSEQYFDNSHFKCPYGKR
jgi:hypothetical protein